MYRLYIVLFSFIILYSCSDPTPSKPQTGVWRGELTLAENAILPFNFELNETESGYEMIILNRDEKIPVESFEHIGDSILIQMAVFDTRFHLVLESPQRMVGYWEDESRNREYKIPFVAGFAKEGRFSLENESFADLDGKWEVHFSPDSAEDEYPAVGLFEQEGHLLNGTFLTETGDYRYLEGVVDGERLRLSGFDGSHVFLFEAELDGETLEGTFWSGIHWEEPWRATKNENFELADPSELTYLKEGYDKLSFTFPNLDSVLVSLDDEKYRDKVLILQLMGSWCPNCLDETKLYTKWYEKYQGDGLEIIALAFERAPEFPRAVKSLNRLKDRLNIEYDILIAQLSDDKLEAGKTLPMLNKVMSFPTSIYIDKSGNIRKIHTGFTGPGTGNHYTRFVEQYSQFIEDLLAEG